MDLTFEQGALLLLIAAVVTIISRRLRLPYSVGLVLAGIFIALFPFAPNVNLTKELLFTALLPPLIFEAALDLKWKELRKELPVVLVLATVGVVISAGVTAAGMHYLASWQWISALVFGVLIAATDPVSVIATFKDAKAHGRLLLLIESESLLNDGTAAVLYAICLELALGGTATPLEVTTKLAVTVGGSLACGAVVAGGALLLAGRTDDHLVEITFTTVAAYGSFLPAEHLHLSGVLATLIAGLMLGNLGQLGSISERGREAVRAFWEYAAFVANSLVFLLIGMRLARQNFLTGWSSIVFSHPAGHFRTGGRRVSLLRAIHSVNPWRRNKAPACFVLGRIARRSRSCACFGVASRIASAGGHCHRQFCGRCILSLRSGSDLDAVAAANPGGG